MRQTAFVRRMRAAAEGGVPRFRALMTAFMALPVKQDWRALPGAPKVGGRRPGAGQKPRHG